jgi:fluoride ion exporter CrcB/FEX
MFTDLPANMLGCFLMGLLVSGDETLGIPIDMPVAMLPQKHWFQSLYVTQIGLRTGLCGSLTTFASWNVQMVQMMCGNLVIVESQWVSALFGYAVGWMVALKSYEMGRDVAVALHRWNNPALAEEANHIRSQQELGILVHRNLPELERRFLHNLDEKIASERNLDASKVKLLEQWKEQTTNHRGGAYWKELREIEQTVLVRDEEPREELMEVARDAGWDVAALWEWKIHTKDKKERTDEEMKDDKTFGLEAQVHALFLFISTCFLIWGFVALQSPEMTVVTYRTNFLSTLLSPFGTLLRWLLSSFNGSIRKEGWEWLPIGTLAANLLAVAISGLAAALTLGTSNPAIKMWEAAVKTGFAGSLSTVSTYIAETEGLLRALPRHAWGYYYSFGSILLACLVGIIFYLWAVV